MDTKEDRLQSLASIESLALTALQYEAECMENWTSGMHLDFADALTAIDLLRQALTAALDELLSEGL